MGVRQESPIREKIFEQDVEIKIWAESTLLLLSNINIARLTMMPGSYLSASEDNGRTFNGSELENT